MAHTQAPAHPAGDQRDGDQLDQTDEGPREGRHPRHDQQAGDGDDREHRQRPPDTQGPPGRRHSLLVEASRPGPGRRQRPADEAAGALHAVRAERAVTHDDILAVPGPALRSARTSALVREGVMLVGDQPPAAFLSEPDGQAQPVARIGLELLGGPATQQRPGDGDVDAREDLE
jgi:hypothetical protein